MKAIYSERQIDDFLSLTDNYIKNHWTNTSLVGWRAQLVGILGMAKTTSVAARDMGYWEDGDGASEPDKTI